MPTTVTTAGPGAPAGAATEHPSPQATRVGAARWLDLRLAVGVLLVLGSVAVGARVVAAADDTVPVLVAAQDLTVDRPLTAALVQTRQVLLEDGLARYLSGDVPEGYVMVRPVEAGELVPRSAVAPAGEVAEDLRYVTLALPAAELPAGLRAGRVVDVWVAPDGEAAGAVAEPLLAGITVTDVGGDGGGLGVSGTERAVTLAVTPGVAADTLEEAVARLVAAARDARVYLAGVPGGSQGVG
ncbi:MAG TPA: hypothetical protein VFR74_10205 [Jiangellales bacterium]|nr:hypothetical protein [Jiangellales bacterium]